MAIHRDAAVDDSGFEQAVDLQAVDHVVLPCGFRLEGVRAPEQTTPVNGAAGSLTPSSHSGRNGLHLLPAKPEPAGGLVGKPLSEREREVLCLLARGASDKEAAEVLGLSRSTVESHVGSLYQKIGATNRVQLGVLAVARKLI